MIFLKKSLQILYMQLPFSFPFHAYIQFLFACIWIPCIMKKQTNKQNE